MICCAIAALLAAFAVVAGDHHRVAALQSGPSKFETLLALCGERPRAMLAAQASGFEAEYDVH